MVTDTSGNFLAGVQVTAAVNGKALRGKDATALTVTTGANGHFVIPNVPVVNVVNNNGTDTGGALTLAVVAPTGYFGATAQVFPQAQVTSSEGVGGQTNPAVLWFDHFNADAGTLKLPKTDATITGTLRNSGTGAPLAAKALRLTFEQVQRDQYGETTCVSQEGNSPSDCNNGITSVIVTYASGSTLTATSDANGVFTFAGVPEDSCMRLYAPGYNLTTDGDFAGNGEDQGGVLCDDADEAFSVNYIPISTNDDFVQLNQVFASASPNADTISPIVVAVDNASFIQGPCGTLSSVVGDTVVIHFSEPVNITGAVDGNNPITVLIGAFPNFTFDTVESATLSADKTTLTLVLADPLPDTADVTIDIPVEDVTDLAGNPLNAGDAVNFDSIISTTNGNCGEDAPEGSQCSVENVVDQLCFNTFAPGTQPTGPLTVTQVNPAENADGGPDNQALNLLFDSTSSLIDTVANGEPRSAIDETGDEICFGNKTGTCDDNLGLDPDEIDQFNAFQDDPRVGTQLDNLAEALNGGTFVDVHTHVARVHLNVPTGTVNFAVALIDPVSGLPKDALFFPVRTTTGGGNPTALGEVADGKAITTINNGGVMWYSIAPNGATDLDIVIAGNDVGNPDKPNPGDIFVAIARGQTSGGTFVLGPAAQVTLQDKVGPTVALQLLGCNPSGPDDCATQGASVFGQGGVVVNEVSSSTGTVVLNVSPQTGDTSEAHTPDNGTPGGYYFDDFVDELWRTSGAFANSAALPGRHDSAGQLRADTDATGTNAYLTGSGAASAANARIAIDVVERVTIGPGALPTSPTGGSSTLSNYIAINSVNAENSSGCNVCNDEVQVLVSRIVGADALGGARAATFENDAIDNDVIDLTGGITDLNGNTATDANNARVVMQDKFPPLVVEAFNDGFNTFIRFNEPILQEGSITFIGCGNDGDGNSSTITLTNNTNVVLSADGLVLQIPSQGANEVFNPITSPGCFSPTTGPGSEFTYAEPIYTSALVTAIADDTGATVSSTSFPDAFQHAEIGYRDVPDAQGNIWDCSVAGAFKAGTGPGSVNATISGDPGDYCSGPGAPDDATFVWAGTQLGMAGPTFEVANILGPFELRFQAVGFANGSAAATFTVTGTHPIGNWFTDQSGATTNPANELFTDLDSASGASTTFCTPDAGLTVGVDAGVTCNAQWVNEWILASGGTSLTCPIDATDNVANNARLSPDQKTLTIHIACDTGTFATGDTVQLLTQTTYDPNTLGTFDTARSLLDAELQSPVSHTFTAN
ncbi:MAG TPA: Ig-like domain-containing protein [Nevskiaceae bacterium]|nr:Ig-like domain-containing protein [Nevskiaceae bacterium]